MTIASRPSPCSEVVGAADVHARGRLVDVSDLEARHVRELAREERPLHRLGEVLLLLVEPGVVDRERRLRAHGHGGVGPGSPSRPLAVERDDRERPQDFAEGGQREHGGRRRVIGNGSST